MTKKKNMSAETNQKLVFTYWGTRTGNFSPSLPGHLSMAIAREGKPGTGVKGALPLGCLPLWGREGVTLLILHGFFILMTPITFTREKEHICKTHSRFPPPAGSHRVAKKHLYVVIRR
jgi:hypothetical protein